MQSDSLFTFPFHNCIHTKTSNVNKKCKLNLKEGIFGTNKLEKLSPENRRVIEGANPELIYSVFVENIESAFLFFSLNDKIFRSGKVFLGNYRIFKICRCKVFARLTSINYSWYSTEY